MADFPSHPIYPIYALLLKTKTLTPLSSPHSPDGRGMLRCAAESKRIPSGLVRSTACAEVNASVPLLLPRVSLEDGSAARNRIRKMRASTAQPAAQACLPGWEGLPTMQAMPAYTAASFVQRQAPCWKNADDAIPKAHCIGTVCPCLVLNSCLQSEYSGNAEHLYANAASLYTARAMWGELTYSRDIEQRSWALLAVVAKSVPWSASTGVCGSSAYWDQAKQNHVSSFCVTCACQSLDLPTHSSSLTGRKGCCSPPLRPADGCRSSRRPLGRCHAADVGCPCDLYCSSAADTPVVLSRSFQHTTDLKEGSGVDMPPEMRAAVPMATLQRHVSC